MRRYGCLIFSDRNNLHVPDIPLIRQEYDYRVNFL